MRSPSPRIVLAGLLILWPSAAGADVFVTPGAAPGAEGTRVVGLEVLILQPAVGGAVRIEEHLVVNEGRRVVWLRPVTYAPSSTSPGPDVFPLVASTTRELPDHAESLATHRFGPSVLTWAARAVRGGSGADDAPPLPATPQATRTLGVGPLEVFSGAVSTSTVTGELFLPEALEAFLRRQDVRLDAGARGHLAVYLAQGWSVLGTVLYDPAPSPEGVARVGPLRLDFRQEQLDLPLLRPAPGEDVPILVSVLASGPRVSGELRSRSWRAPKPARGADGEMVLTFAAPLREVGDLAYRLADQHGLVGPEDAFLVRGFLSPGPAQLDRTTFVAPAAALEPTALPPRSRRGDPGDVARCVALGLVPLLFAPESWFFRWLEGRSRARARSGGSTLGVKVWAAWSLVVGAYWWVVLVDAARVAAVVPLLVGALQLALPYTDRDPTPVRVTFRRARREAAAKRASARPKRETAEPSAGPQSR